MKKQPVLLVNNAAFLAAAASLPTYQVGAVVAVAMDIAASGPLPAQCTRKTARLKGRQQWLSPDAEQSFFHRADDKLTLNERTFGSAEVGTTGRTNLSVDTRARIHARDGFTCVYCGDEEGPFHVDHIVPVSRCGSDEDDNLCLACVPCNLSKRAKLLSEWRAEA